LRTQHPPREREFPEGVLRRSGPGERQGIPRPHAVLWGVHRTLGSPISNCINRFRGDDGQTLVEYSLILLLVAIVVMSALTALGDALDGFFQRVVDEF